MNLVVEFTQEMLALCKRAQSECGYNPTYYRSMLTKYGGIETARRLLRAEGVSDGYATLWRLGRLDLSVESVALDPRWSELFTSEERAIARRRLEEFQHAPRGPN